MARKLYSLTIKLSFLETDVTSGYPVICSSSPDISKTLLHSGQTAVSSKIFTLHFLHSLIGYKLHSSLFSPVSHPPKASGKIPAAQTHPPDYW